MPIYNGSVLTISILVFLLGAVAVKSARSGWARLFIISTAVLVYSAVFIGPLQLLSYAKPTTLEWVNRNVEEAEVLHAELREGDGIYLLLDWYGTPRYYKIAWDADLAQELIEAMEQARGEAGDGDRPGSMPPQEDREGQEGDQGMMDQALGPMGEDPGEEIPIGTQSAKRQGEGEGSQTTNAGNGKVMMRRPFQGEQEVGSDQQGENTEGKGPGSAFEDINSAAMFYAKPQPRYPEKTAPGEVITDFKR